MEKPEIKVMSFKDNLDLPKVIYKYRKWDDVYQKTILTERVVFMAPPSSFEDKNDCKLLKRYDLMSEQDMYNKYLELSKRDHPTWNLQKHRSFAREWTKKSPLKDNNYIKQMQEEYFLEFDNRFGVLSLTANPTNFQMWTKFSDEGRGFCVGFDPTIMFNFLGGGGSVQYYDELPQILYNDIYHVEHFKQVFSKEKKWEFEEEYRTHKFYPQRASLRDRQIKIPSEAYKELYFGWNISEETKNEIIKVCREQNLELTFKDVIMKNENLEIKTWP